MIPKEHAHLQVAAITHQGMSGKNNEDRYAVSAYQVGEDDATVSLFAIVADGIGGHQAGEIAAEIVTETISHAVANSDASDPIGTLNTAIIQAGQAVHAQSVKDAARQGMGSTCACVWVIEDRLYTASVGDSRIYLLRDNSIRQITIDHTWVQEAIEFGIITPDQARGHPQSHIIRRYLGSQKPTEVDFRMVLAAEDSDEQAIENQGHRLEPGDGLVLCSDGLTDLVEDAEILAKVENDNLEKALQELVDLANQRGGHDNITIVALEVPQPTPEQEKDKSSSRRTLWIAGILAAILTTILVIALGILAWQLTRPEVTPTPHLQETVPLIVETSLPATEIIQPTLTPSSSPRNTPSRETYTPWPTSTP